MLGAGDTEGKVTDDQLSYVIFTNSTSALSGKYNVMLYFWTTSIILIII